MKSNRLWWLVPMVFTLGSTALFMFAARSRNLNAETSRAAASILSPKRDGAVGSSHEIVGKMSVAGQPVVLVRPEVAGGSEWYVQPCMETNERGFFKSKARFGSDKTAPGQRFQIAVVVARTKAEAEFFKGKEFVPVLPDSLAHSAVISVVLGDATATPKEANPKDEPSEKAGYIMRPRANEVVHNASVVSGKVRSEEVPVVLVRNDEPNENWWVQGPVEFNKKGEYRCVTRFGNETTPAGQKFRVVVLALNSAAMANQYTIGKAIPQLPDNTSHSEEIVVTLERAEAKAPEAK